MQIDGCRSKSNDQKAFSVRYCQGCFSGNDLAGAKHIELVTAVPREHSSSALQANDSTASTKAGTAGLMKATLPKATWLFFRALKKLLQNFAQTWLHVIMVRLSPASNSPRQSWREIHVAHFQATIFPSPTTIFFLFVFKMRRAHDAGFFYRHRWR